MIQPLKIIAFAVFMSFSSITTTANPLYKGQDAYEAGDLSGAFSHFMMAAKSGDAEVAVYWFKKTAIQECLQQLRY